MGTLKRHWGQHCKFTSTGLTRVSWMISKHVLIIAVLNQHDVVTCFTCNCQTKVIARRMESVRKPEGLFIKRETVGNIRDLLRYYTNKKKSRLFLVLSIFGIFPNYPTYTFTCRYGVERAKRQSYEVDVAICLLVPVTPQSKQTKLLFTSKKQSVIQYHKI